MQENIRIEKERKYWNKNAPRYDRFLIGKHWKSYPALLDKISNDFEVLEIGSGPGTLTIPLAKRVKKVVAVESSETAVDYLRRNMKESQVENVDLFQLPSL